MRRRQLLKLTGAGIASTAFVGTASAHVEDPYADRWVAADPSNYTNSSRGAGSINWLIMHVTQGSYGGTVSWFQNPDANVSTQYVIRNADGHATQMVHNEDIAWHAGGQNYNTHSIGFEHEGFVGQTNFTDALYRTSADIARWLCERYDIPKEHPTGVAPCDARNGGGIIGHHQVPESDCGPNNHTDPGSTWDWDYYMSLVHGGDGGSGDFAEGAIVESTTTLNTREQPGTESTVVDTMPTGADAEIVNGPVDEDGYRWWGLHWLDHGVWGWSVERYLQVLQPATFQDGAAVHATTTLNTREQPGTGSTVVGTMPTNANAEIVNGPVDEDGYRWWGLHWLDQDVWGWSVERYLDLGHV